MKNRIAKLELDLYYRSSRKINSAGLGIAV